MFCSQRDLHCTEAQYVSGFCKCARCCMCFVLYTCQFISNDSNSARDQAPFIVSYCYRCAKLDSCCCAAVLAQKWPSCVTLHSNGYTQHIHKKEDDDLVSAYNTVTSLTLMLHESLFFFAQTLRNPEQQLHAKNVFVALTKLYMYNVRNQ